MKDLWGSKNAKRKAEDARGSDGVILLLSDDRFISVSDSWSGEFAVCGCGGSGKD